MSRQTVSLTMMVRDEAAYLEQALEAALPLCDEFICAVDETSCDRSEDIARAFLARIGRGEVYKYKWSDHFSNARNAVLDKATGDWIVNIDGHEIFRPGHAANVRAMLDREDFTSKADFIEVGLQMDAGDHNFFGYQIHVFKNDKRIRFQNEQHNKLMLDGFSGVRATDVIMDHLRTEEQRARRHAERQVMTQRVMGDRLKVNPLDGTALYYLATTYEVMNEPAKAEELYRRLVSLGEPETDAARHEKAKVLWRLGCIRQEAKDWPQAKADFEASFSIQPDLAETMCGLSDVYQALGDVQMASHWLRLAMVTQMPSSAIFFSRDFYTWLPPTKLASLMEKEGRWSEAIEAASVALATNEMPAQRSEWLKAGIAEWSRRVVNEVHANATRDGGRKNLVVFDSTNQFTGELVKHWSKTMNVRVEKDFSPSAYAWSDIAWFEWCDENVIQGSRLRPDGVKTICRLHRYEQWNRSPEQVNWPNIDVLLTVAPHVKRMLREFYPIPSEIMVLPNGIDLDKFTLSMAPRSDKPSVAFVGFLHERKGIRTLLDLADRLRGAATFNVLGTWQDPSLERFCRQYVSANELSNVTFHPWTDDVNAWHDKVGTTHVISLSTDESCHLSVVEGMAKGARPLVLNWYGAKEVFPSWAVFYSVAAIETSLKSIGNTLPIGDIARAFVSEKHSLSAQLAMTDKLFEELSA